MWKGTAATLNPNPTSTSPRPIRSSGLCARDWVRTWAVIAVKLVVAVAPYTSAMPYNRNPDAKAPSRKYLSAASAAAPLERLIPASTRSEEHTSELQSQSNLVCRLLLEKKN